MYDRILIPLDGSDLAQGILPHIIPIAKIFGSEVILLHAAVPVAQAFAGGVGPEPALQEIVTETETTSDYLQSVGTELHDEGLKFRIHITPAADAADGILDYAKEGEASLIAMSTHGRSGPAKVVFGSVAEKVIRNSHLPVLVIRP